MKVIEHIKSSKRTAISFEILPPMRGQGIQSIYDMLDPLMEFKPSFIDVTAHREEYIYKEHPNGLLEKKTTRKRPGTVGICAAIKNKYDVDTVPHIICGGFTKEETEYALIDLNFLGIENVMALRGDQIKSEQRFAADKGGNQNTGELINQIVDLNKGVYLHEDLENAESSNFCIGVAGYPEKHFESPNMKNDLKWLKKKVEAGAEYVVTQMFFNNQKYFEFVDKCRAEGINIPIIPGLKPVTVKNHLSLLPKLFSIDIPEDLGDAIDRCKNNEAVKQIGIEWGINQVKELKEKGVPLIHFYTMGKPDSTRAIVESIF